MLDDEGVAVHGGPLGRGARGRPCVDRDDGGRRHLHRAARRSTIERMIAVHRERSPGVWWSRRGGGRRCGRQRVHRSGRPDDGIEADCDDPLFAGLTLEVDYAIAYRGRRLLHGRAARSVVLEQGSVTLFGGGQALTNEQVLRSDNAAVGLRLLGQGDGLIWYVPTFEDLGRRRRAGRRRPAAPAGSSRGSGCCLRGGVPVVWRARRLGRLATEPLPVVVKAIETTRSRGRLYRQAQRPGARRRRCARRHGARPPYDSVSARAIPRPR